MKSEYVEVGVVKSLIRYPVKSFAGENVEATRGGWHGLEGDRRFAFVRTGNMTGFPWLTAREVPDLVCFRPYFTNHDSIRDSSVRVVTPSGIDLALESDELLSELRRLYGKQVHLMQLWSGIFDAMDVSLITTATVISLSEMCGRTLDVRRFRPNIIVEPTDKRAFPEDKWVSEMVVFGDRHDSLRLRLKRKDVRCKVVNVDPDSAETDSTIFRQIVIDRKSMAGVYGTTEWPGTVQLNDIVRLIKR
jgi:uncharacterized protein YcbX